MLSGFIGCDLDRTKPVWLDPWGAWGPRQALGALDDCRGAAGRPAHGIFLAQRPTGAHFYPIFYRAIIAIGGGVDLGGLAALRRAHSHQPVSRAHGAVIGQPG